LKFTKRNKKIEIFQVVKFLRTRKVHKSKKSNQVGHKVKMTPFELKVESCLLEPKNKPNVELKDELNI